MASVNDLTGIRHTKSGVERAELRHARKNYTYEIIGGRVISSLTGRVVLVQPPDKPKPSSDTEELDATIEWALAGENQLRAAKQLGGLGMAGAGVAPDDLFELQGVEVEARELVPVS